MFKLLQHNLLAVSSVVAHLFYLENGQTTIGHAYTLSKCCFVDLCNFRLAVAFGLQTSFLTQTLFKCLKVFETFFWLGEGWLGNVLTAFRLTKAT